MKILRRDFLRGAAATAGALATPSIVRAQSRQIVLCGPGSISTPLREYFFSKFEEKTNCTILFEGSNSLANLEKMRADTENPLMSIVMMDDPVMVIAYEEGLLDPLTKEVVPNLERLLPKAVHADGAWINYQYPRAAIAYNTDKLPEGIDSWQALWDPRFEKQIAIPSLELTQGVWTLIAAAHIGTGLPLEEAMQNIDAGFDQLMLLKPNLLMIYNQSAQGRQLLENGEISLIGGEVAHSILTRRDEGAPIEIARPIEGSFAMPNGMALVANAPEKELACELINEFLSDEYQYQIADKLHADPTVPNAPVPDGFVREANMFVPDWFYISRNRAEWIDRWQRTIGRS